MCGQSSFDKYRMPDELWEEMSELLPERSPQSKGGRPRADRRAVADAIFYRMRTGCQWKAIPSQLAPGSTAHDYFQRWVKLGIFEQLWNKSLDHYDDLVGLEWRWQSVDGAMTKSPLGGEKTGKNPTDRGKLGTKRSLQTDARGIPIGVAVGGANTHDTQLLQQTIEDCFSRVCPKDSFKGREHMCLDKAYDSAAIRSLIESIYGYVSHIRSRGEEQKELTGRRKARRWVVERTHGWLNRFRAILVRWEKKVQHHIASLHLAFAYFIYSRSEVFG